MDSLGAEPWLDESMQRTPGVANDGPQQHEVSGGIDDVGVRVVQALLERLRAPTQGTVRH